MPGHATQDSLDMKLRYEVILNTLCDSFNNNIHHTQESYIDLLYTVGHLVSLFAPFGARFVERIFAAVSLLVSPSPVRRLSGRVPRR